MSQEILQNLLSQFSFASEQPSADCSAIKIPASEHRLFFEKFKADYDFDLLCDVTAVDWDKESPRFTVVYHFYSVLHRTYLRVAVDCVNDEEPSMPTVSDLWAAADWHERETFDMFGIVFEKHPNLKRILMWDSYPYHPLRKDFPLAGHEVEFPAEDVAEVTGIKVQPAPMAGGPFVAGMGGHTSNSEPQAKDQSWTEQSVKPTN